MNKELEEKLRNIQSHPTTGLPFNKQIIDVEVETIFAIDKLNVGISRLIKTIEDNDKQNQKLENSNINLQRIMLVLTFITTIVVIYPAIKFIVINYIYPLISILFRIRLPIDLAALISTAIGIIVSFIAIKTSINAKINLLIDLERKHKLKLLKHKKYESY